MTLILFLETYWHFLAIVTSLLVWNLNLYSRVNTLKDERDACQLNCDLKFKTIEKEHISGIVQLKETLDRAIGSFNQQFDYINSSLTQVRDMAVGQKQFMDLLENNKIRFDN